MAKGLKADQWKPANREEELRTWREWLFTFTNYLIANDPGYGEDLRNLDLDTEVSHDLLPDDMVERSQRLYGLLCSLLRGRPLLLIKPMDATKCGYEAMRVLRNSMEPREKARSLALLRSLASWKFDSGSGLHEQLVKYEEALRTYELASQKVFPEDLVLATVLTGMKEPLRSQLQLRMGPTTKYQEVREWILQWESLNTPWATTTPGSKGGGRDDGGPRPMEVDRVFGKDGKGKGKKGKDGKGKGKDSKGKGKGAKGKDSKASSDNGKGSYNNKAWSQWSGGSWGSTWDSDACRICGQRGHWKWECPQAKGKSWKGGKGKDKGKKGDKVQQVEGYSQGSGASSTGSTTTSSTSLPPSASVYRGSTASVNMVAFALDRDERECPTITEVFDLTELDDDYEGPFGLEAGDVMMIEAVSANAAGGLFFTKGTSVKGEGDQPYVRNLLEFNVGGQAEVEEASVYALGVPVYSMDATDWDNNWCLEPGLEAVEQGPLQVNAVSRAKPIEVVIDSGADVSVAPLEVASYGKVAEPVGVKMQDAQGKMIKEHGCRVIDVVMETAAGEEVMVRERFAIARVGSMILSLGRLLRQGWQLGHHGGGPTMEKGDHRVPITLRRNTLMVPATISVVVVGPVEQEPSPARVQPLSTYDDLGRFPPEAEEVLSRPGWSILPSGLPMLVIHKTEELNLEQSVWEADDWSWVAIFVRLEQDGRPPQPGDVWVQLLTMRSESYETVPQKIVELDEELEGRRDVAVLFHVEEIPRDLLSNPRDLFCESPDGARDLPKPEADEGGGLGEDPLEVEFEGEAKEQDQADPEDTLEGVRLHVETPLRKLRELCDQLGLSRSGGKPKVLARLRQQREILERRMTAEIARKMYLEGNRDPEVPRAPILPSAKQQELHSITHQPFQSWCEHCVLGRSRQSPHKPGQQEVEQKVGNNVRVDPVIQIDYAFTFTKRKHEPAAEAPAAEAGNLEGGDDDQGHAAEAGHVEEEAAEGEGHAKEDVAAPAGQADRRDQFGLCLVAAESTTGWLVAVPVQEKGAGSLKRVTEQLVRLSLQVSPGDPITIQGDPEPSIKQILNAVEVCRGRLGLKTTQRLIEKGSHQSNGQAEKAIDNVRRSGLTLKSYLEERIQAKVEGDSHVYAWLLRHAGFLMNRFSVGPRGATSYEIMHGRKYRGKLVPFGEQVIFHRPSKHRGELQWTKGVFLGVNERNHAFILGTAEGAMESRSIRRLPESQQWDATAVLSMKGLPWNYMGRSRRKRALYTQRVPLLPDSATLDQLARAAGQAAAEAIAAATPGGKAAGNDEAASDPPSPTSSSTSSSPTPREPAKADRGQQPEQQNTSQEFEEQSQSSGPGPMAVDNRTERGQQPEQQNTPQESGEQSQSSGHRGMEDVRRDPVPGEPKPDGGGPAKRARLLLDKQQRSPAAPAAESHGGTTEQLYPPTFAGVRRVHGDVLPEELCDYDGWPDDLRESLATAWEEAKEEEQPWWDDDGEDPPALTPEELEEIDKEADRTEINRLIKMGVARWPEPNEDLSGHALLTTKVVRDWRRRPKWVRRSRLVGREYRSLSAWTEDLFAPSTSLAVIHSFVSYALARGLNLYTCDVKDAYLNVPQPTPVMIQVDKSIFGEGEAGFAVLILERLLPGQRAGASGWYNYAKDLLEDAGLEHFPKEPTLFKAKDPKEKIALLLHADDGLLGATEAQKEKFEKEMGTKVTLQMSGPLKDVGDELEFLKRRYVMTEKGVVVYANTKYLEALESTLGPGLKRRESPSDHSFLEPDSSKELGASEAKKYKECVGRLMYLAHSRPDVQFPVCILSSKMSAPTTTAMRWLQRVVGYLASTPEIGFLIRPAQHNGRYDFEGDGGFTDESTLIVESITDADWAGCKRSRKSRTSLQLYVSGSLVGSAVRSQRSIALSSGESEFVALVAGACEALYLKDCLSFLAGPKCNVEVRCRTDSSAGKGITQRLGCGRVRHLQVGMLWVQAAVKAKELFVGSIPGAQNPADLGTKPLGGGRVREVLCLMGARTPSGEAYGVEDKEEAERKREVAKTLKEFKSSGATVGNVKTVLPLLLLLLQATNVQGLSWAAPLGAMFTEELAAQTVVTAGIGTVGLFFLVGLPYIVWRLVNWLCGRLGTLSRGTSKVSKESTETQANCGMSPSEEQFVQEYVKKCRELESLVYEKCRENERFEEEVKRLRHENRALSERLTSVQSRHTPALVKVAPRGIRFHLPTCPHIRNSATKSYSPCADCLGQG